MRVLVIHQHYWPETAATAQLLTDLCEDLAAAGHHVTVLAGQPSYHQNAGDQRVPAQEWRRGVSVVRVPSIIPGTRALPARVLQYGSFCATSLVRAISERHVDVCLVMSTPPLLLGLSGSVLSALRGIPFVYSVQDIYPDVAVHLGVLKPNGAAARLSEGLARATYQRAAAVITLSAAMADALTSKGVSHERLHVIPNWADTSAVRPERRDNAFAREHGLTDGFVVQYAGNLGLSQGLDYTIATAALLRNQPITFAFVGDGNARAHLQREARQRGLTNIRFLPPQPREQLSVLLASSDVGLVSQKIEVKSDLVPSKLYGIMAAARPVMAAVPRDSEVARVVRDAGCGWVCQPESASSLADALVSTMATSAAVRAQMGARGRATCEREYSREAVTRRYESVLRSAVATRQAELSSSLVSS